MQSFELGEILQQEGMLYYLSIRKDGLYTKLQEFAKLRKLHSQIFLFKLENTAFSRFQGWNTPIGP
jgi:hypothetical protein